MQWLISVADRLLYGTSVLRSEPKISKQIMKSESDWLPKDISAVVFSYLC